MLHNLSSFETRNLKVYHYGIEQDIPADFASMRVTVEQALDPVLRQMRVRMVAYIAQEDVSAPVAEYPSNWWEACKERFAPQWFLKRWPVQYTEVIADVRAFYPKLAIPEGARYVQVVSMKHLPQDPDQLFLPEGQG